MKDFCDICGKASGDAERYHPACLRRLFGTPALPAVELTHGDVLTKAQEMAGRMSISGVQPKLSINDQQPVTTPAIKSHGATPYHPRQYPHAPSCDSNGRSQNLRLVRYLTRTAVPSGYMPVTSVSVTFWFR